MRRCAPEDIRRRGRYRFWLEAAFFRRQAKSRGFLRAFPERSGLCCPYHPLGEILLARVFGSVPVFVPLFPRISPSIRNQARSLGTSPISCPGDLSVEGRGTSLRGPESGLSVRMEASSSANGVGRYVAAQGLPPQNKRQGGEMTDRKTGQTIKVSRCRIAGKEVDS